MSKFHKEFLLTLKDTGNEGAGILENRISNVIDNDFLNKPQTKVQMIIILHRNNEETKDLIKVKFEFT